MLLDLPNEVLSLIASYSPQALYPCSRRLAAIALPHRFCTYEIRLTRKHVENTMAMLSFFNKCNQEFNALTTILDQEELPFDWGPPELARGWQIIRNVNRINDIFAAIKGISVYGAMSAHHEVASQLPSSPAMIRDLENMLDMCYHLRDDPLPSSLAPTTDTKRAILQFRADAARSLFMAHTLDMLLDPGRSIKCIAFIELTELFILRHIIAFLGQCRNLQSAQFVRCIYTDWLVDAIGHLKDFHTLHIYDSYVGRSFVANPFTPIGWNISLQLSAIVIHNREPLSPITANLLSHILLNLQSTQYLDLDAVLDFPPNFQFPPQLRLPLVEELLITEQNQNQNLTTEQSITYPQVLDAPKMYRFEGCFDLFSRLVPSQFAQITDLCLDNWVPVRELHTIISKCTEARSIACRLLITDVGKTANHLQLLFAALPKTVELFDCQPPFDGTYEPVATVLNTYDWIPKVQLPNLYELYLNAFYLEDIEYAGQWEDGPKAELGKLLVWLKGEFPQLETFCNLNLM